MPFLSSDLLPLPQPPPPPKGSETAVRKAEGGEGTEAGSRESETELTGSAFPTSGLLSDRPKLEEMRCLTFK